MLKEVRDRKSPNWYARGTVGGQRIYESTGTSDRSKAQAYCRKRFDELYDDLVLGKPKPTLWSTAVIKYLQMGGSDRYLAPLNELWKDKFLTDITSSLVADAGEQIYRGAKASTLLRQVYGPVIAVLRCAKRNELPGSSFPLFDKPKAARVPAAYATDDYLKKVLPHCEQGLAAGVLLISLTGLRTGELLRLEEEDFLLHPGYVNVRRTKTGKPALIPLPVGWEWPKGGWGYQTSQGFNKALRRACESAGVHYLSAHKIGRHAFAARMLNKGYDLKTVKEAGRWDTMAVVDAHYAHLETRRSHEAMIEAGKDLAEYYVREIKK